MNHVKGDLLKLAREGVFDVIAHGCNCFCTMGAGIAKGIAATFPEAYAADRQTTKGDRAKLGTCTFAETPTGHGALIVVNAYTQFDFRGSGTKADYAATRVSVSSSAPPRKRLPKGQAKRTRFPCLCRHFGDTQVRRNAHHHRQTSSRVCPPSSHHCQHA